MKDSKSDGFRRIPALDGVRGIAILMILVFHSTNFEPLCAFDEACLTLRSCLWCGVDLFFVLSGFLITVSLVDTREHPKYFTNFYGRRSVRIFPLYCGVLFAVLIVAPFVLWLLQQQEPAELTILRSRQFWLWSYLQNFLQARGKHMLPGFGPFWSLAIEEQFYIVWPLIVYYSNKSRLMSVCVFGCIAVWALRVIVYRRGERH